MARSKRLNSILRFAETDERHAAQSLAESGRAVQECQGKLEDMRRYRHEYAQRLQTGDAMDAGEIQGVHRFLQQLDVAIGQLEAHSATLHHAKGTKLQQWLAMRNKAKAVKDIANKWRREEVRRADNKEQFELDDRAQRKRD